MALTKTGIESMSRIVVLESTALFQLGSQFEHVDFAELLELKELLFFDIVVSRVSWLEFLRKRKTQVSECVAKIRQLGSSLEKLGQSPTELTAIYDRLRDFEKNLETIFEKKLSDVGIGILPLAKCDLEDLERVTKPLRDSQATPEARCAAVNFGFANHPGVAWWFEWKCRVRPLLRAAHI